MRWWVHGEPTPLVAALQEDLDAVLASPRSTAREHMGRKRFYRVQGESGEPALFVKVFGAPSGAASLLTFARTSKARREARCAGRVAACGFNVALPVATAEERRLGLLRGS